MSFKEVSDERFPQFEELKKAIQQAYEEGVSLEDAERHAARCLDAQIGLNEVIQTSALDARLKKNGYKTLRASNYLAIVQASDKKPTEAAIDATLSTTPEVTAAEDAYQTAEIETEALKRYFDIFRDAHIYFRGVAKGSGGMSV
jgi:hypothetical protein